MKYKSNYYNEERRANALRNIEKYDWAKKEAEKMIGNADSLLNRFSYSDIWELMPSQKLFRSGAVSELDGCPVCGHEIDKFGNYPYTLTDDEQLWKLRCPNCKTVFPSNDFESYYRSALDENGVFHPENGNRELLKNTLYPEKGESWCVDDGYGYDDGEGHKYTFICYYNLWKIWRGYAEEMINSFSGAYAVTGDRRYSDAVLVVLARFAQIYPELKTDDHIRSEGYGVSDGGSGKGKILGCIWDTGIASYVSLAFDAVKPAIETMGEEALAFIKAKTGNEIDTPDKLKSFIDKNVLCKIYEEVVAGRIRGNNGMHQKALVAAALAYDDLEEAEKWIKFLYSTSEFNWKWGSDMSTTFINQVDRDGFGTEASPGYNLLWLKSYVKVAEYLRSAPAIDNERDKYDLYSNPKFRRMFYAPISLTVSDKFYPHVGDSSSTANPGRCISADVILNAYSVYRDPVLAQAVYFFNNDSFDGLSLGLFGEDPEELKKEMTGIIDKYGRLRHNDTTLASYGYSAFRFQQEDGETKDETLFYLYYGRNIGHGHNDNLNFSLYAYNGELTPDLGYPEYANSRDMHRRHWVSHPMSHNTVTVNRKKQQRVIVAKPERIFSSSDVKVISVSSPEAYSETSVYKRSMAFVNTFGSDGYLVDFFRVNGGTEHAYSFHFGEAESMRTEGVKLVPQTDGSGYMKGTLLSPDISFGEVVDESGQQYLVNVQRDISPEKLVSFDCLLKDTRKTFSKDNVHLKYTLLSKADEIVAAQGIPPRNKPGNPKYLNYVYAFRRDEESADSLFVSLIEPYSGKSNIVSAKRIPVSFEDGSDASMECAAVKVTLTDGSCDTLVYCSDTDKTVYFDEIGFRGFMAVIRESADGERKVKVFDSEMLSDASYTGAYKGKIKGFTEALSVSNYIDVSLDGCDEPSKLTGRYIHTVSDSDTNAVYLIRDAKKIDGNIIRLDVGDRTTVRSVDKDGSYKYFFETDADCRIPLDF